MRRGLLAAMAALFAAAAPARADLAAVKSRGVLQVLVNLDRQRPEFFSLDPGSPPGFDRELLEGFARLHRVKVQPIRVDGWGALVPALLEGKGDLIAGRFTNTPMRRQVIDFTTEVFPYRLIVFTRRPHRVVRTLEELRQERIGTTRGSVMSEVLDAEGVPASARDESLPTGTYVAALRAGTVTAAVWGVESVIASQKEDPALQLGMFLGPPGSLAYGVRKDDPALLAALNEYIGHFRKSPSWSRLVVKYFGEAAPDVLRAARGGRE